MRVHENCHPRNEELVAPLHLIKLVVLKRPGFQSQKYGMPNYQFMFLKGIGGRHDFRSQTDSKH